jgi:hypothetical protein
MSMAKKQIHFFAIEDDLVAVFKPISEAYSFEVCDVSDPEHPKRVPIDSRLFTTSETSINSVPQFMLVFDVKQVKVRYVQQRSGGQKAFCDQVENQDTLMIRFGGMNPDCNSVIAGVISSGTSVEWSELLFKRVKEGISKNFRRVKSFYVGRRAYSELKKGTRLTMDTKAPREFDLSDGL